MKTVEQLTRQLENAWGEEWDRTTKELAKIDEDCPHCDSGSINYCVVAKRHPAATIYRTSPAAAETHTLSPVMERSGAPVPGLYWTAYGPVSLPGGIDTVLNSASFDSIVATLRDE